MPRKPTGKPNGRPKIPVVPVSLEIPPKEIVLDKVFFAIDLQCTAQEIAGSFRVSVDTLDARLKENFGMGYAELFKRCNGEGKLSLRRFQFRLAEKNASMAIFLGKNWLGQEDRKETQEDEACEDLVLKQKLYAALYENQKMKKELDELKPKANSEL